VVFPELLAGVLAGNALQDLGSARVFLDECCPEELALRKQGWIGARRTSYIIHVRVDDNIQSRIGILVCGHIGGGERLGHDFEVVALSRTVKCSG
jgi:hypothetical protein